MKFQWKKKASAKRREGNGLPPPERKELTGTDHAHGRA